MEIALDHYPQHLGFTSSERNQLQCNEVSRWCSEILLDVCRKCDKGMANLFWVRIYYCTLLWLSAGIFRKYSTCCKPHHSLQGNHSPLSPHNWMLYFVSLSIRVLLFLLLVVAGDIERNPGPPKTRMSEGEETM